MTKRTKKITEADLTAILVAVLEAELSEFINGGRT